MKRSYIKEIMREIIKSKGRFISLIAIVALGAGFFGGIKATSADMKLTADEFYKDFSMMDFRVMSTLGVTDEDAAALEKMDGVDKVMPSYQFDTILTSKGENKLSSVGRLHSYTPEMEINTPDLLEGRLPETADECLLVSSLSFGEHYAIGDKLIIDFDADPDAADNLAVSEFTIVGLIHNPLYLSIEQSSTSKGSGKVSSYWYVPAEAFNMEAYSEIYITMQGVEDISCFDDEYTKMSDNLKDSLKDVGNVRNKIRYNSVVGEAQKELDEAREEFEAEKADAEQKLADGAQKIADAEKDIADAEKKLTDGEQSLIDGRAELEKAKLDYDDGLKELSDAQLELTTEIADAEKEFAEARQKLQEGQDKIDSGRSALSSGERELSAQKAALAPQLARLPAMKQQLAYLEALGDTSSPDYQTLAAGIAALESAQSQLASAQSSMSSASQQLADGQREIDKGWKEYKEQYADYEEKIADATKELEDGWAELEDGAQKIADAEQDIIDGQKEIADGKAELEDGKIKLEDAKKEYEEKKADAEKQIADAEIKLDDAQTEINDIESPTWYVQSRADASPGYASFEQDAARIDAVAALFPIFFFLVAALVCLTTMTRIVEDERTQIGILKAMGYTKLDICGKYIFYAVATSVIGSIIGLAVCFKVFPNVVWSAYSMMYISPPLKTPWNNSLAVIAILIFAFCTVGSTLLACMNELNLVPAELIRPKPPKNGKRIVLERIKPIWSRLSFTAKLTARNIFRYKKRFFMTIVGIAGCTALMITGFGVKDSISGIVGNQFGRLFIYDAQLAFSHSIDENATTKRQSLLLDKLNSSEYIEKFILANQSSVVVSPGSAKSLDATLTVIKDNENAADFITLQTMNGKHPIEYPQSGAVITQKLADELNLKIGGSLSFKDTDDKLFTLDITAICENYVSHYIYISPEQYQQIYGEMCSYQTAFVNLRGDIGTAEESDFSSEMLKDDEVMSVFLTSSLKSSFADSIANLNFVVVVLIISAGLLAFVVLYSLTNINIAEREREIATIKVLGFYNREVDSYIYRENAILTILGILIGCGFGIYMHKYVMRVAEVNLVMFGREIFPISFVYSALLTILFSLIVNIFVHFKLKRINMVESLKSVE